ncbi:MAG: hypothetical protein LUF89_08730 [Ruminococcus sp.]|nr:hypothetical protein [Ruminococcus sp.]
MKKHKIKACFMLILAFLSLFTGCISQEEKQKANEYINEAKPYLTQYLSEHYPGAVSKSFENVTRSSYDLFVTTYASPAVRMTYEDDGQEYHIVYNVDTGSYYEDQACDEITRVMWMKLQEICDFYDFRGWKASYNWYNGNEGFSRNYYRAGEDTLDALLNGDYEFTVTVSYEETPTDLSNIDLTVFEKITI